MVYFSRYARWIRCIGPNTIWSAFGPKTILFCYFVASVIVLICLLANISFAKSIEDYERFPADKDGEDSD